MSISQTVLAKAKQWSLQDPNETTSSYVKNLLARTTSQDAAKELSSLFPQDDRRIGFGTAGLRAAMEPGPLGMNDLVIIQTAQGLARYCLSQNQDKSKLCAVVGYDHRANPSLQLSSLSFALLTSLVFEEAGIECVLLDGYVHTPLVPFATTKLKAAVAVMITASHNPKNDAGYKVYWSDACQIRPPVDKGIAESILSNLTPWTDYKSLLTNLKAKHEDPCLGLSSPETTSEMINAYFNAIQSSGLVTGQSKLLHDTTVSWNPPSVAYTAMHGVGHDVAVKSFETFSLLPFHAVPLQAKPDYTFPTVPFPNPEEKGALDLAMAYAEENGCDIVLANDPDADRLAVAERNRVTGKWTAFHGDQIGTMLGLWLWESIGKDCGKPVAMCASTVSSKMLATIAKREGFHFEETLTGFKWIGSRAAALARDEGYRALFGYEEAIGFSCGSVVYDKDGISALGVITELAYHVYHKGGSLAKHMQSLYDKYGEFVSNNGYYFCNDPAIVQNIMEDMRNGGKYMSKVREYEVESIRDLGVPGYDSTTPDHRPTLPTSKSSPMMTIRFTNGCVAQFRGSGTEPKFKYYIEMQGKPGVPRETVSGELMKMSQIVLEELLKPGINGLSRL